MWYSLEKKILGTMTKTHENRTKGLSVDIDLDIKIRKSAQSAPSSSIT